MEDNLNDMKEFLEGLKSKEKRCYESAKIAKDKGNSEAQFYQEGKATAYRWIAQEFEVEFL